MGWVPNGRIAGEIMSKLSCLSHCIGIPYLDLCIGGTRQYGTLVQMTPFDAVDFSGVGWHHLDWTLLWGADIPQSNTSITTSAQELVLIGLIEADIECCVRSLHLSHYIDTGLVDVEEGDAA